MRTQLVYGSAASVLNQVNRRQNYVKSVDFFDAGRKALAVVYDGVTYTSQVNYELVEESPEGAREVGSSFFANGRHLTHKSVVMSAPEGEAGGTGGGAGHFSISINGDVTLNPDFIESLPEEPYAVTVVAMNGLSGTSWGPEDELAMQAEYESKADLLENFAFTIPSSSEGPNDTYFSFNIVSASLAGVFQKDITAENYQDAHEFDGQGPDGPVELESFSGGGTGGGGANHFAISPEGVISLTPELAASLPDADLYEVTMRSTGLIGDTPIEGTSMQFNEYDIADKAEAMSKTATIIASPDAERYYVQVVVILDNGAATYANQFDVEPDLTFGGPYRLAALGENETLDWNWDGDGGTPGLAEPAEPVAYGEPFDESTFWDTISTQEDSIYGSLRHVNKILSGPDYENFRVEEVFVNNDDKRGLGNIIVRGRKVYNNAT